MDNTTMPPVQPSTPLSVPSRSAAVQAEAALIAKNNSQKSFIKTIIIVMLSLVAITFIILFVWILMKYNDVNDDVTGRINSAVAAAKQEQAMEDEKEFAEREKDPYRTFAGPADYGELTFKYPKTWSVYIAADAVSGGDFSAYLNPMQVDSVSNKDSIYALRVTVRDKAFDVVATEYQKAMDKKDSGLSMETITVGGAVANKYTGKIPGTELNGFIVIFKIRDKTAILQTDSVLFENDFFNTVLKSIEFNA
ncbi:hypothetical protein IJU85_00935 [Candidatus Saccharibacteria bacterium]|nr:hypothetical protein [Candidatus Saccharibacteria bacterium]